jgi:hypothetical protein
MPLKDRPIAVLLGHCFAHTKAPSKIKISFVDEGVRREMEKCLELIGPV